MPTLVENKRARYDYTIVDAWECGIVLTGPEVKSAKRGSVDLSGSYVEVRGGQLWLVNCHIAPYPYARGAQRTYNPKRRRKLLVARRLIASLAGGSGAHGLTLIPLRVYTKQSLVKFEIALVKGKRRRDKREQIKRREIERTIRRAKRV